MLLELQSELHLLEQSAALIYMQADYQQLAARHSQPVRHLEWPREHLGTSLAGPVLHRDMIMCQWLG